MIAVRVRGSLIYYIYPSPQKIEMWGCVCYNGVIYKYTVCRDKQMCSMNIIILYVIVYFNTSINTPKSVTFYLFIIIIYLFPLFVQVYMYVFLCNIVTIHTIYCIKHRKSQQQLTVMRIKANSYSATTYQEHTNLMLWEMSQGAPVETGRKSENPLRRTSADAGIPCNSWQQRGTEPSPQS